jgi:hypothetical protein
MCGNIISLRQIQIQIHIQIQCWRLGVGVAVCLWHSVLCFVCWGVVLGLGKEDVGELLLLVRSTIVLGARTM